MGLWSHSTAQHTPLHHPLSAPPCAASSEETPLRWVDRVLVSGSRLRVPGVQQLSARSLGAVVQQQQYTWSPPSQGTHGRSSTWKIWSFTQIQCYCCARAISWCMLTALQHKNIRPSECWKIPPPGLPIDCSSAMCQPLVTALENMLETGGRGFCRALCGRLAQECRGVNAPNLCVGSTETSAFQAGYSSTANTDGDWC